MVQISVHEPKDRSSCKPIRIHSQKPIGFCYTFSMLGFLLASFTVSLSNFSGALGLGIAGVNKKISLLIVVVFTFFELIMPIMGMIAGRSVAYSLAIVGKDMGAITLFVMGVVILYNSIVSNKKKIVKHKLAFSEIAILGFLCSLDNLVLGFVVGISHTSLPMPLVAGIIVLISTPMTVVGLQLGKYVGHMLKHWSVQLEGVIFMILGTLFFFSLV